MDELWRWAGDTIRSLDEHGRPTVDVPAPAAPDGDLVVAGAEAGAGRGQPCCGGAGASLDIECAGDERPVDRVCAPCTSPKGQRLSTT